MAKVTIEMSINEPDHPLQYTDCFFDGIHKRCKWYKTLSCWFYIKLGTGFFAWQQWRISQNLQGKLPNLGICLTECLVGCLEKKDTCSIQRYFWDMKQVLTLLVSKKNLVKKLLLDTVFTYQWHFKNSAQQKVNSVGEDFQEEFLQLCYGLFTTARANYYNLFKYRMDDIAKVFHGIGGWVNW